MTSKDNKDEIPRPNIFLYYANIMDYFRVVSALGAFFIAKSNPFAFEVLHLLHSRRLRWNGRPCCRSKIKIRCHP